MAQGTLTLFEEFALTIANGVHDLDTDSFKIALISDTGPLSAATATPDLGDFSEVSGGTSYTAGGEALTTTWTEAGGTASFKSTQGTITWSQDASGPTNIRSGIIYNTSAAGNNAIAFVDFTSDNGTTAISLQDGDITWTPDGSQNIFTLA